MTVDRKVDELRHKADKAHWEQVWSDASIPPAADPEVGGIRNLFVRRMDGLFRQIFSQPAKNKQLLELGCGSSVWLPYFAQRFGFGVSGIDYSPRGCRLAEEILEKEGVAGRVYHADFFNPPEELIERFDVVYSAGVAEHFDPTAPCIAAFAKYLKPGGLMITIVPNLAGAVGRMLKMFNPPLYDVHVPLKATDLRSAHEAAGLQVERCGYFLSTGCVASTSGLKPGPTTAAKQYIIDALRRLAAVIWWVEDKTVRAPGTRLLSPFIVCVARKP